MQRIIFFFKKKRKDGSNYNENVDIKKNSLKKYHKHKNNKIKMTSKLKKLIIEKMERRLVYI